MKIYTVAVKVFLIALLIFFLDKFNVLDGPKRGISDLLLSIREKSYQRIVLPDDQNEKFKRELLICQAEILGLKEENAKMRKMLDAGLKPELSVILAKVIAFSNNNLIVAVGSDEKVKTKASAVVDRIFLGQTAGKIGNSIKVTLITSPETKIPVKIWISQEEAGARKPSFAEGILVSDGVNLLVKEILVSQKVGKGDFVGVVAEKGEIFFVGRIEEIKESDDKIFQEAKVDWLADPKSLLTIGIIKG